MAWLQSWVTPEQEQELLSVSLHRCACIMCVCYFDCCSGLKVIAWTCFCSMSCIPTAYIVHVFYKPQRSRNNLCVSNMVLRSKCNLRAAWPQLNSIHLCFDNGDVNANHMVLTPAVCRPLEVCSSLSKTNSCEGCGLKSCCCLLTAGP